VKVIQVEGMKNNQWSESKSINSITIDGHGA